MGGNVSRLPVRYGIADSWVRRLPIPRKRHSPRPPPPQQALRLSSPPKEPRRPYQTKKEKTTPPHWGACRQCHYPHHPTLTRLLPSFASTTEGTRCTQETETASAKKTTNKKSQYTPNPSAPHLGTEIKGTQLPIP